MKSVLIFALTMIVSLVSLSQSLITVKYTKTSSLVHWGDVDYKTILQDGFVALTNTVNQKKVIDLEKMTMDYYVDGKLDCSFLIEDCKVEDGTYILTLLDTDTRTGNPFKTKQIIDTKNKRSYYTWYYDGIEDTTCLIDESGVILSVK